jgi:hypothetical protein
MVAGTGLGGSGAGSGAGAGAADSAGEAPSGLASLSGVRWQADAAQLRTMSAAAALILAVNMTFIMA